MQSEARPINDVAAIFDIDETLVRGASSYWAAKEMFLHHFFGVSDLAFAAFQTLRFVLFGENIDKIDDFTHRAAQLVAGRKVDDLRELGEEIFERYFLPNAYKATLERLQQHLAAGHQVFLASATPWIISEVFADRLGATLGLGTRLKVADGALLPELDGPILHANGKALVVNQIAKARGIDLSKSWAYSDSSGDIPLLSLVGNPVAVNPDPGLRAYAKLRNWEILHARTRKDKIKRRSILFSASFVVASLTALFGFAAYKLVKRKLLTSKSISDSTLKSTPEAASKLTPKSTKPINFVRSAKQVIQYVGSTKIVQIARHRAIAELKESIALKNIAIPIKPAKPEKATLSAAKSAESTKSRRVAKPTKSVKATGSIDPQKFAKPEKITKSKKVSELKKSTEFKKLTEPKKSAKPGKLTTTKTTRQPAKVSNFPNSTIVIATKLLVRLALFYLSRKSKSD